MKFEMGINEKLNYAYIKNENGFVGSCNGENYLDDTKRIVLCLNACDGANNETLIKIANGEMDGSEIIELAKAKNEIEVLRKTLADIIEGRMLFAAEDISCGNVCTLNENGGLIKASPECTKKTNGVKILIKDIPLGEKFSYLDGEKSYILLQRYGSGLCCDVYDGSVPAMLQGVYSIDENDIIENNLEVIWHKNAN